MAKLFRFKYRKGLFAFALLIGTLFSGSGLSQTDPQERQKEFEGRYEYLNGISIEFAPPRRSFLRHS